ncbi:MAG: Gfo/Idh/MocA family oxidoreductase, partial [Methylophilaceae bacterium]
MESLKVGLLGIGTVGGGTYTVLQRNQAEIANRAGRQIEIVKVADRDLARAESITGGKVALTQSIDEVVSDPNIDVVVELIGGYTLAKEAVLKAIANGKHVVTANKALLALHGNEIF